MAALIAMRSRVHLLYGSMRCLLGMASLCSVLGTLACGSDSTSPPAPVEYWALQLNQHAVTLALTAPHNTIRLTATPTNAVGQPLTGLGHVHYVTSDSTVTVDTTGLVTAQFPTSVQTAFVIASLTDVAHNLTLVDTCFLQVTATAPTAPLAMFSLQAPSFVSTSPAANGDQVAVGAASTTATDDIGNAVAAFPSFTSSDSTVASINRLTGNIYGHRVGQVTIYATTWAYGVAMHDSAAVTVGYPAKATIAVLSLTSTGSTQPILTFWPQIVTVVPGAVVGWDNKSFTDSMDVVFDDPTNVDSTPLVLALGIGTGSGNIPSWVQDNDGSGEISARFCIAQGEIPANTTRTDSLPNCDLNNARRAWERQRKFPVAGTYHYHSVRWGTSGTIIVHE